VFYASDIYAVSPTFSKTITQDRTNDVTVLYENLTDVNDLSRIKSLVNIETSSISSNGTHLEIKMFSEDLPSEIFQFLKNNNSNEFFINVLINSDDDVDTGFLGYDYRYLINHNNSKPIENKNIDFKSNTTGTGKSLHYYGLLSDQDFHNSSLPNEFEFTEPFDFFNWTIAGHEIIDYNYEPLLFSSAADYKYLSFIPDGIRVLIDLKQMNYPSTYSLLFQLGAKSNYYKVMDTIGQLHFPVPNLSIGNKALNVSPGKHSDILNFNSTYDNNLFVNVNISDKTYPKAINITFPQGNKLSLFGGSGSIPVDFNIDPKIDFKNYIVPINLSYGILDSQILDYNQTSQLTQVHNYSKILYLSLNVQKSSPFLFSFPEIPPSYMAVILTALLTIFIPSVSRLVNDYNKKRIASSYLRKIYKNYDENNIPESINNVKNVIEIIKHEFIRGRITKDQYTILIEKFYDMLKELMNRNKENSNQSQ